MDKVSTGTRTSLLHHSWHTTLVCKESGLSCVHLCDQQSACSCFQMNGWMSSSLWISYFTSPSSIFLYSIWAPWTFPYPASKDSCWDMESNILERMQETIGLICPCFHLLFCSMATFKKTINLYWLVLLSLNWHLSSSGPLIPNFPLIEAHKSAQPWTIESTD